MEWLVENIIFLLITIIVLAVLFVIFIISRIIKCPADKIIVITGKVGKNSDGTPKAYVCLHGGAVFIYPLIQNYSFLDINPISIQINLKKLFEKIDILPSDISVFTIAISTEKGIMEKAAEYLLGLSQDKIKELAEDIIYGQIRSIVEQLSEENAYITNDELLEIIVKQVETEIEKIGLQIINIKL